MALSVRLLKKVKGFSLELEWQIANEIAVLFGYSGAGKSMTLKMLDGLMRPDHGQIILNGSILFDSEKKVDISPRRRPFGYVFQDPSLFPHMTAERNIAFGLPGVEKEKIKELVNETLHEFKIEKLRDRYPDELSGGEKQRVTLARALIRRPSALLLDEPFSALDLPVRLEMRRLLLDIKRGFDIPVILVTHDIDEARTLADRIIIYSAGKIEQQGTPEAVFQSPLTKEVERLVRPALSLNLPFSSN